ncbi:MOSC domain-containing protein [Tritonibacter scottomollicae]|uniref:MOSC domain-containing protein n=1 Tax=Tritonibacter scottomollicae TaxID=483013 RepID=UPI003AA97364
MSWTGTIVGLHTTPRSFLPMRDMAELELVAGVGIAGDRYATESGFYSDRPEEGRQITLFEVETLEALKRDYDIDLAPSDHRRNVTTRGVPLNHLVGHRFWIGPCLLEATRLSTPCRHIEQITGKEVFEPFLHRSGLHARILKGGAITTADNLRPE